jgi:hypothetical protein
LKGLNSQERAVLEYAVACAGRHTAPGVSFDSMPAGQVFSPQDQAAFEALWYRGAVIGVACEECSHPGHDGAHAAATPIGLEILRLDQLSREPQLALGGLDG